MIELYKHHETQYMIKMTDNAKVKIKHRTLSIAEKVISEEHDPAELDLNKITAAKINHVEVDGLADSMVSSEDIRIWIDPLDATQEYTENLLQYVTTMVCVAVKGEPIIGVIHKPFENFTAWAWAPDGASTADDIAHIIVSRSHTGQVEEVARHAFGEKTNIIKAGGAGFTRVLLIKCCINHYIEQEKYSLRNAILKALDGKMTTLDGNPIDYGNKEEYKNEGGVLATLFQQKMV
ncbi:unnamed protein product, partial [Meganyctiphanes norvegica]